MAATFYGDDENLFYTYFSAHATHIILNRKKAKFAEKLPIYVVLYGCICGLNLAVRLVGY